MESGFDMYMNSTYNNSRENCQTLLLKDDAPGKTFNLKFFILKKSILFHYYLEKLIYSIVTFE